MCNTWKYYCLNSSSATIYHLRASLGDESSAERNQPLIPAPTRAAQNVLHCVCTCMCLWSWLSLSGAEDAPVIVESIETLCVAVRVFTVIFLILHAGFLLSTCTRARVQAEFVGSGTSSLSPGSLLHCRYDECTDFSLYIQARLKGREKSVSSAP